jgi:hypothetical protein
MAVEAEYKVLILSESSKNQNKNLVLPGEQWLATAMSFYLEGCLPQVS